MKKPRNGHSIVYVACRSSSNNSKSRIEEMKSDRGKTKSNKFKDIKTCNNGKSFYEVSLSVIISLWCLLFLFYSRLGLSHENAGKPYPESQNLSSPSVSNDNICNYAYSGHANGGDNCTNGMLPDLNNSNNVAVYQESVKVEFSPRETKRLEEVILRVLGYTALVCDIHEQERQRSEPMEKPDPKNPPTYLNLDEFKNIQERSKDPPGRSNSITHRLEPDGSEYNYASAIKGAKVVSHNKEAKGANNILGKDHDMYLRNPCSVEGKFVVIELAEETLVDEVRIANFEHYSSNFKEFELSGSLNYPTEIWSPLGKFVAANVKQIQTFKLSEPKWLRYMKLNLLSHYGSEFYCTLSAVEVYGVDAIERMLEDLFVPTEQHILSKLADSDSTGPSVKPDARAIDGKRNDEAQNAAPSTALGIEHAEDVNDTVTKNPPSTSRIPDPLTDIKQLPVGRIPGDTVLKILMQKVRTLDLNLSVLEEFVKELNRRQGDEFSEMNKELFRFSQLLEKSRTEIKEIMQWKEIMQRRFADLESWKDAISSSVDALVRENSLLRLDVEKIARDQSSLETKELAVLSVSLFFACIAILNIVSTSAATLLGATKFNKVSRTSSGWVLILVSSSMTIFITLLSS